MSKSTTSKQPSGSGQSSLQLMPGIGMVDLSQPELSGRLAEIAAAELATFQAAVRQGCWRRRCRSASVSCKN